MNEPWLSRNGSSQYPWVSLLEKACSWASGKKTPAEAAGAVCAADALFAPQPARPKIMTAASAAAISFFIFPLSFYC